MEPVRPNSPHRCWSPWPPPPRPGQARCHQGGPRAEPGVEATTTSPALGRRRWRGPWAPPGAGQAVTCSWQARRRSIRSVLVFETGSDRNFSSCFSSATCVGTGVRATGGGRATPACPVGSVSWAPPATSDIKARPCHSLEEEACFCGPSSSSSPLGWAGHVHSCLQPQPALNQHSSKHSASHR